MENQSTKFIITPYSTPIESLKRVFERHKAGCFNSISMRSTEITSGSSPYVIVLINNPTNEIIGTCIFFLYNNSGDKEATFLITSLYVRPRFRRRGYAIQMINFGKGLLMEHMTNSQLSGNMQLCVHQDNAEAINLFDKFGFKTWSTSDGHYQMCYSLERKYTCADSISFQEHLIIDQKYLRLLKEPSTLQTEERQKIKIESLILKQEQKDLVITLRPKSKQGITQQIFLNPYYVREILCLSCRKQICQAEYSFSIDMCVPCKFGY